MTTKPTMTGKAWCNAGTKVAPNPDKINSGWSAEKPPYQNENWLQHRSDAWMQSVEETGIPDWDSTVTYGVGAYSSIRGTGIYRSIQASNINHSPTGAAGWWEKVDDPSWSLSQRNSVRSAIATISDFNLIVASGLYVIDGGANQPPVAGNYMVMAIVGAAATEQTQFAANRTNGKIFSRQRTGGTWGSWNEFVRPQDYATNSKGGTIKMRVSGSVLYITNNGVDA